MFVCSTQPNNDEIQTFHQISGNEVRSKAKGPADRHVPIKLPDDQLSAVCTLVSLVDDKLRHKILLRGMQRDMKRVDLQKQLRMYQ